MRIPADAVDTVGVEGLVKAILSKIGPELPVYLSIDIDVLDPAFAPGTGAPEPGGWTSRELIKILRGISHINIVGADVVEVAPAYDTNGGDTAFVVSNLIPSSSFFAPTPPFKLQQKAAMLTWSSSYSKKELTSMLMLLFMEVKRPSKLQQKAAMLTWSSSYRKELSVNASPVLSTSWVGFLGNA